ncbi:MAG: lysophospholipid acyltransferase family protein [Marinobacter sp.]|uniref:lysophospholipid acyltransferase family protein n=1 Tax=Marinobacter sp. TaxID=50741 RepID=UPI00299DD907|nr:lysophospholipid acyltransferase family protein [Marinobacter sp.]MDX1757198.1 lysophospholipid acyltransferase family protein [Marinobacter sp.]
MSKRKQQSRRPLWHPAYWPSWCVVFLLYALAKLPESIKRRWSQGLGRWLSQRLSSRARVVDANLRACMPELSDDERAALVESSFVSCTRGLFESLQCWWGDTDTWQEESRVEGMEHLQEAIDRNRGVLMIGGHYSILDLALPLVGRHLTKPGYMYRPNDNPVIDRMIEQGRRRHFNIRPFSKRQLKDMIGFLKQGGQVWYGCDQDFGRKTDVFAPFFGVDTGCISTPTYIARESGASVLCVSHVRMPCGRYRVAFSPILENFGDCPRQDALSWNGFIEETVRAYPDQYLWLHKRFKTRPAGAAAIY